MVDQDIETIKEKIIIYFKVCIMKQELILNYLNEYINFLILLNFKYFNLIFKYDYYFNTN